MRMRFKPYAKAELEAAEFCVNEPIALRAKWHSSFKNSGAPLHLELGCGKGGFIAELASRNANINYIGIDITDKVLVLAKRKIEAVYEQKHMDIDNVKILSFNIERIAEMMAPTDTVQRIYINFCNPWNRKSAHKKHRLTYTKQLVSYLEFLAQDGEIYFKCDDEGLFDDSVEYFAKAGLEISFITRDLHKDEPTWNIRTEHEEMFSSEGIKIKALIAKRA